MNPYLPIFANRLGAVLPADAVPAAPAAPYVSVPQRAAQTTVTRPTSKAEAEAVANQAVQDALEAGPDSPSTGAMMGRLPATFSRDVSPAGIVAAVNGTTPEQVKSTFGGESGQKTEENPPTTEAPTGWAPIGSGVSMGTYVPPGFHKELIPYQREDVSRLERKMYRGGTLQQEQADIQAHGQKLAAYQLKQMADDAEDAGIRAELQRQQRERMIDDKIKEVRSLSDAAATAKIEPGRIFSSGGAGTAFMVAIGGALGGMLSARTGGPNQFQETLDKIIDRDISAQRANIDQMHNKAAGARTELGELRDRLGDQRLAEQVQRMRMLQTAGLKIDSIMASTNSDVIRKNGEMARNAVDKQIATTEMELNHLGFRNGYMTGGMAQPVDRSLVVRMPDGRAYEMPTKEGADKIRANLGYTLQMQSNINQALAIRKGASAADLVNPYSEVSKKLRSLAADTAQIVTVRKGQGAMSKGDQAVADESIGAMTGPLPNNDNVLRSSHARYGKQMDLELQGSGAEQITPGYRVGPTGQIQTTRQYDLQSASPPPAMPKLNPLGSGK